MDLGRLAAANGIEPTKVRPHLDVQVDFGRFSAADGIELTKVYSSRPPNRALRASRVELNELRASLIDGVNPSKIAGDRPHSGTVDWWGVRSTAVMAIREQSQEAAERAGAQSCGLVG